MMLLQQLQVDQQTSGSTSQPRRQLQHRHFSVDFPATLGIDPDKVDAEGQALNLPGTTSAPGACLY